MIKSYSYLNVCIYLTTSQEQDVTPSYFFKAKFNRFEFRFRPVDMLRLKSTV